MTEIEEGDLKFTFRANCEVGKYDEWSLYRSRFNSIAGGSKAVDILCVSDEAAWLIEIKDYREHGREKPTGIDDELVRKVRDTLAGLAAASANANDGDEQALARRALRAGRWRVALHLEQPRVSTPLRPKPFDVANLMLKLRKKVRAVDADALILDREANRPNAPWTVQ